MRQAPVPPLPRLLLDSCTVNLVWWRRRRKAEREEPTTPRGSFEPFRRALEDRTVLVHGPIDDQVATLIIAQLLYLEDADPTASVLLRIESPGGVVTSALGIHDSLERLTCPVTTQIEGTTGGIALLVGAAGTRGHRRVSSTATASWRPTFHPGSELDEGARAELARLDRVIFELFAACSTTETAERLRTTPGITLSPEQLVELELADEILPVDVYRSEG